MKVDRRGNNLLSDGGCQRMTSFTGQGPGVRRRRIQPYTDFLSSLGQQAETPLPDSLDHVLKSLRGSLQWEIRRRGLRDASPTVLGLVGYQRWWATPSAAAGGEGDALEELATDCYVYVFIDRLRSLMAQLKAKGNVDGLVRRNVRNFVHDRQKRNDPLGFRVFRAFRRAAEESIAEQRLFVLEEHRRLYNDTLLGFAPEPEILDSAANKIDLTPIVARWNDALLSELMTARGPRFGSVVRELRARLLALEEEGLSTFRCRDIIEPLKADARKRWATLWRHGDGSQLIDEEEPWPMAATSRINSDLDDRQGFIVLSSCIEKRLESSGGQERTRRHLLKLWRYLKKFAMSDVESGHDGNAWRLSEENLPSHRELSRTLEIPRERIPGLFATIRRATQKCLSTSNAGGVGESPPCAVRRQVMKDRREELLQSTGKAYRRLQQSQLPSGEQEPDAERPSFGKLYALQRGDDLGVEWLAVDRRPNADCWFMIPADPHPWLGSADWELISEGLGPLTLRCDQGQWLAAEVFEDAIETATLTAEQLSALRRALAAPVEEASSDEARLEVDEDSEYQAWCRELQELGESLGCRTLETSSSEDVGNVDRGPSPAAAPNEPTETSRRTKESPPGGRWRRPGDGFLTRAALILLALGLAHGSGRWLESRGTMGVQTAMGQQQALLEQKLSALQAEKEEILGKVQSLVDGSLSGPSKLALIAGGLARSEGAQILDIPERVTRVVMLMELPPLQEDDRLEILRPSDGTVVWHDGQIGIDDQPEKNVVIVPSLVLPEGLYGLRVVRSSGEELQSIFATDLEVVRSP